MEGVIVAQQLIKLTLGLARKHMEIGTSRFDDAELLSISQKIYTFDGTLRALQTYLQIDEKDEARLQTLNHLAEPLNQCKEALGLLSDQLGKPMSFKKHLKGERFDRKLKKSLSVIENAREVIELALLSDQHTILKAVEQYLVAVAEDIRDIHTMLNENRKQLAEIENSSQELKLSHEQDRVIRWLQYTDPYTNHTAACELHEPRTGNWLLQSDDFTMWKWESKKFLWLHGIPGCGKTVLSSTVVEDVKTICKNDSQCQYAFYYFDFSDSKKREVAGLLRSILTQLASRDPKALKEVENLYNQNDHGRQQPDKKSLLPVILSVLRDSLRAYLIIDALDECSQQGEVLKILSDIHRRCPEVNILVTSRKEHDIGLVLDGPNGLASSSIDIQQTVVDADIRIYIKACLAKDMKLRNWSLKVKEEMEDALVRGAHGMFRWVVCQLEVLRKCLRLPALRRKLKELPETLDETYNRILLSIPEEYYHEAYAILQWLAYSRRPMSLAEIAEATTVDRDNQAFDTQNRMLNISDTLSVCSSLVTLSEGGAALRNNQTKGTGELRLAHYSVKEYLVSRRIQNGRAKKFAIKETEAHEYMGEVCLIYLLHFNRPDSIYVDAWVDYPFLQYAAEFWYGHRRAVLDASSEIKGLCTALFDTKLGSQFINWLRLHDPRISWSGIDLGREVRVATAPLYYACLLGILEVVEKLLAAGADVNATASDWGGQTALQAASGDGHLEVVERLLAAGADVNASGGGISGRAALQAASGGGYLEIVERLLAAGADVNAAAAGWGGLTALQAASGVGHLEVVERLLAAGADVNAAAATGAGRTALRAASGGGHLEVVERLLAAGADVNAGGSSDRDGWTALQATSRSGHLEIVERLLAAGADVNAGGSGNWGGRTALQGASEGGHLEIVERLLAAGADVNAAVATKGGLTALQAASGVGHLEVVERLLAAGADVNAAAAGWGGQTALQAASKGGHLEAVERLLAAGANVNAGGSSDRDGRTALQAASAGGHVEIVERLLAVGADVNAAVATKGGRTALQAASEGGHLEVVERLLTAGADANAAVATEGGRAALQAASGGGHLEVVERLLAAGADVNAGGGGNWGGRTALQVASKGGRLEVVKRLLAAGANVNAGGSSDRDGRTALQAASGGGHLEIVERLLAAGADVNAAVATKGGRTALQAASGGGHLKIVERLLAAGADVSAAAAAGWGGWRAGRTALQAASGGGHVEIVERLLAAGGIKGDQKALQAAFEYGHLEIVKKLLAAGADVNATAAGIVGDRTELQASLGGSHLEVAERLRKSTNAGSL